MLAANIPIKVSVVWAASASSPDVHVVPIPSQQGVTPGAASFTDGFVPDNFLPVGVGGIPPFGNDFNGVLQAFSQWIQWFNAGGPVAYDATFQGAVSGYPKGAVIASGTTLGQFWLSLVDGNTSDPDTGGANWSGYSVLGGIATTGDIKVRIDGSVQAGWTRLNGNSVGNGSSNATELADPSALAQFTYVWTNFSNTQCPVLLSTGSPTTRGVSAAADFAANRQIILPDLRGYSGVWGADTMGSVNGAAGRYANVTFGTGNQNTPGSLFGANTSTLTSTNQLPPYTPSGSISGSVSLNFSQGNTATNGLGAGGISGSVNPTSPSASFSGSFSGNSVGASSPISTAPRGIIGTIYMKL